MSAAAILQTLHPAIHLLHRGPTCTANRVAASPGRSKEHIVPSAGGRPEDVIIRVAAESRGKSGPVRRPTNVGPETTARAQTRGPYGIKPCSAHSQTSPAAKARVPRPDQVSNLPPQHTARAANERRRHHPWHEVGPANVRVGLAAPSDILASPCRLPCLRTTAVQNQVRSGLTTHQVYGCKIQHAHVLQRRLLFSLSWEQLCSNICFDRTK